MLEATLPLQVRPPNQWEDFVVSWGTPNSKVPLIHQSEPQVPPENQKTTPPFPRCVALGKLLNLSVSPVPTP